jgi:hypothetical protein
MKDIFNEKEVGLILDRIGSLRPDTPRKWGKMSVAQMLAHCNVSYELIYDHKHPRPGAFKRFLLRAFIKNATTNETPYKPGSPTAPVFIVREDKNFEAEKSRLVQYIRKTMEMGPAFFEGKESHSFGKLTLLEWNNMLYKHLDHHLKQFGV